MYSIEHLDIHEKLKLMHYCDESISHVNAWYSCVLVSCWKVSWWKIWSGRRYCLDKTWTLYTFDPILVEYCFWAGTSGIVSTEFIQFRKCITISRFLGKRGVTVDVVGCWGKTFMSHLKWASQILLINPIGLLLAYS